MPRTDNRARLHVDLLGNWRLYAGPGWPVWGWQMIGTVERGEGDVGALACSPAGAYCQVNAGSVRSLDQRKIVAALADSMTGKHYQWLSICPTGARHSDAGHAGAAQTATQGGSGVAHKKPVTPAQVAAAREKVGLTQAADAALIDRGDRVWRAYEAGSRELDPILWQVWRIRAGIDPPESIL